MISPPKPKRSRDPNQLAKQIVDEATGQAEPEFEPVVCFYWIVPKSRRFSVVIVEQARTVQIHG